MPKILGKLKFALQIVVCSALQLLLVFDLLQPSVVAQDQPLPPYATWRVGDFGERKKPADGIYRIQYSPDGRYIATRNNKNIVSVYDLKTRGTVCEVEGHERKIDTIDFTPDGEFFMTASGDGDKVKIWKTQTGALQSDIDTNGLAAFFDKTGKLIHILGDTHVESYSWPGAQITKQRKWQAKENETAKFMSRDGRYVVAFRHLNRQFYETLLIDTESKSKVPLSGATGLPRTVKVSADNQWVAATYNRDPKIRLWEVANPKTGRYTLGGHEETVQSLSFSPDNRFLVSSGWDKNVFAWDLLTRQSIQKFQGHEGHVNATACAPLGFELASGSSGVKDASMITWNMEKILFDKSKQPDTESELSLDEQFEPIWKSLGTSSLKLSLAAASKLSVGRDYYLPALEKRIQSTVSVDRSATTEDYLEQLDAPEYSIRQQATEALLKMVKQVETRLRAELKKTTSPEVKYRISMILKREPPRAKSDLVLTRRWYRIILALEQINTERSQSILKSVSLGHRRSDIATHALESLQRNEKRRARDQ